MEALYLACGARRPQLKRESLGCCDEEESVSTRTHYLCGLLFEGRRLFFLWFSDDHDGLEQASSGTVLTFPTSDAALAYARQRGLQVEPDPPALFDFDAIARWCERPSPLTIRCDDFLNAWNLLGDLRPEADSIFRAADRRGTPIYDKLFFGCNLPSITPKGEQYAPTWSDLEVQELARVLRLGLAEFRARLAVAAA